ncbi:preprotein translocase subunit YajC [Corynebacterium sp.]|uniref:preprotein translocase subunit YajC n=1 Tax=Corynebacterium sp. TaxID=1720 RepID=UPI0026DA7C62|nr:preprotein translocase subunit YajC [Corynebacterium sp.]MDO4609465.1 preprotein translocase subunit YajC [Corynebacterium sp.]
MDPLLLLILMLILLALPLWQTFRHNKQIRAIRDMQSRIQVGDRVQTGAGVHGIVESLGDTTVELTIAQGVTTVWERAAIMRNHTDEDRIAADDTDAAAGPAESAGDAQAPGSPADGPAEDRIEDPRDPQDRP